MVRSKEDEKWFIKPYSAGAVSRCCVDPREAFGQIVTRVDHDHSVGKKDAESSAQAAIQSARDAAAGDAEAVHKDGMANVDSINKSAESNRDAAIQSVIDTILS